MKQSAVRTSKRWIRLLSAWLLAVLLSPAQNSAPLLNSAEEQEFRELMERGSQMMGMLGISLKEKDKPGSVDAAAQASAAFADMYKFWEKKNVSDAMQFSRGLQQGFAEAGSLAAAGQLEEALTKFQVTRTHCDGCHQAHRTRNADGSYSVK